MRLLLENSETQEFLTPFGKWSKNPLEGKIFGSITVALRSPSHDAIEKFNLIFLDPQANQYLKLNYR
jgi:hypothetical protein